MLTRIIEICTEKLTSILSDFSIRSKRLKASAASFAYSLFRIIALPTNKLCKIINHRGLRQKMTGLSFQLFHIWLKKASIVIKLYAADLTQKHMAKFKSNVKNS